jgi:hypothetical protein
MEKIESVFLGEVKPFAGRWTWPLSQMQPGEYFVVDHVRKHPEQVRAYVSMRAASLMKRFSVNADDPEMPGYCRVTCVPLDKERREPQGAVMDYAKLHPKLAQWYGLELNAAVPWGAFAAKQKAFVEAEQLELPPVPRVIVRTELPDGWFGLVFKRNGFEFYPLKPGSSLKSWQVDEPQIDEVMS